ncbi:MAG: hypothetical protein LAT67_15040, partial [Balneolales bacterium]|nr:hypothetical protein [Balneolales bacterium]
METNVTAAKISCNPKSNTKHLTLRIGTVQRFYTDWRGLFWVLNWYVVDSEVLGGLKLVKLNHRGNRGSQRLRLRLRLR